MPEYTLHYVSDDGTPEGTWSIYRERYASQDDDEPIDGSQEWVSRHDNEEEAYQEASRLQELIWTIQNPLPQLTADWKVIRHLSDAIAECVDGAVQVLVDEYDLPDDERTIEALTDYVMDLATRGEAVWTPEVPNA